MSAIVELAAARRDGSGITGVERKAAVALRPGSVVALPWREFWLPWVVVEEAVPLGPAAVLVLMRRIRPAADLGGGIAVAAVGVRFGRAELVDVLSQDVSRQSPPQRATPRPTCSDDVRPIDDPNSRPRTPRGAVGHRPLTSAERR